MNWNLELAKPARKQLDRLPPHDRAGILAALKQIEADPRRGDVVQLDDPKLPAFRRRVGSYRILFDLCPDRRLILITGIVRRTTTTYR